MANNRYGQDSNLKQPKSGHGVSPKKSGPTPASLPMRTASWPSLPGKSQSKDRANGIPEEKVYAYAQGLRGGVDDDPGESKNS